MSRKYKFEEYKESTSCAIAKLALYGILWLLSLHTNAQDVVVAASFNHGPSYLKGLYDVHKGEIIPCIYDEISVFLQDSLYLCIVVKDGKYGVIDINSNVVIPMEYDKIQLMTDRVLRAKKAGKYGVINFSNQVLVSFDYDDYLDDYYFNDGVTAFSKNGKWGIVANNNQTISPFIYDRIYSPNADRDLARMVKNEKYGLINRKGEEVMPPLFDDIGSLEGFIEIKKNGKYGIMKENKQLVAPIYDYIIMWYKDFFKVRLNKKMGLLSKKDGRILVPIEYDDIQIENNDKTIFVKKNNKWGLLDESGVVKIPLMYDEKGNHSPLTNGNLYKFNKNGKYGIVNKENQIIVPFEYDWINFDKSYIEVVLDNKCGLLDSLGNQKIPIEYSSLRCIKDTSYIIAKKDGFYGLISENNELLIPFQYSSIKNTNRENTLEACFQTNCKIINYAGEEIFSSNYNYSHILYFGNGLYAGRWGEKWTVGNYLDNTVSKTVYDEVEYTSSKDKIKIMILKP